MAAFLAASWMGIAVSTKVRKAGVRYVSPNIVVFMATLVFRERAREGGLSAFHVPGRRDRARGIMRWRPIFESFGLRPARLSSLMRRRFFGFPALAARKLQFCGISPWSFRFARHHKKPSPAFLSVTVPPSRSPTSGERKAPLSSLTKFDLIRFPTVTKCNNLFH